MELISVPGGYRIDEDFRKCKRQKRREESRRKGNDNLEGKHAAKNKNRKGKEGGEGRPNAFLLILRFSVCFRPTLQLPSNLLRGGTVG